MASKVNTAGAQPDYHVYYPFGEEATAFDINADRMQFTGHERDLNSQTGTSPSADDLDYMHARFFNEWPGRFTSVDPLGGNGHEPQSWNRYNYVLGNPLKLIDPTGMAEVDRCSTGYCFGSITVTAEDPLNGFYDFLWASYNFFGGASNAYSSNALLGFGRYNSTEPGYQLGQAVGDLASIPAGLEEALVGGGIEGGGIILDLTGAGAVIGIPANVLGGLVIAHGGTTSALGAIHFMEGMKKSEAAGKSKSSIWKGLQPWRGKTKTNGVSGKGRRYYEWDHTHGEIEVYDSSGRHLGAMDPETGAMTKPAVPGRGIDL